ncbi:Gti1/Pac2 family-domain-containing protein [Blastocladiella britannica]|nr:Gti1/Pac2 family-domain-containing protein [Blastocladiella britannica]
MELPLDLPPCPPTQNRPSNTDGTSESYFGTLETIHDVLLIVEGVRRGVLNRVTRRLSPLYRDAIRSGSVFVRVEGEARIQRWTDGKTWSPSRLQGSFLVYKECEERPRPTRPSPSSNVARSTHSPSSPPLPSTGAARSSDSDESTPTALRKGNRRPRLRGDFIPRADGLIKRTITVTTSTGVIFHVVAYVNEEYTDTATSAPLGRPVHDTWLPAHGIAAESLPEGLYPPVQWALQFGRRDSSEQQQQVQSSSPPRQMQPQQPVSPRFPPPTALAPMQHVSPTPAPPSSPPSMSASALSATRPVFALEPAVYPRPMSAPAQATSFPNMFPLPIPTPRPSPPDSVLGDPDRISYLVRTSRGSDASPLLSLSVPRSSTTTPHFIPRAMTAALPAFHLSAPVSAETVPRSSASPNPYQESWHAANLLPPRKSGHVTSFPAAAAMPFHKAPAAMSCPCSDCGREETRHHMSAAHGDHHHPTPAPSVTPTLSPTIRPFPPPIASDRT